MKKFIALALLVRISTTLFSQSTTATVPVLTKNDYLQKSKQQKKTALVCTGGGTILILTGMAVAPKDYNPFYDVNTPQEDRQYRFAETLALTGLTSLLVSIPFFIGAHRNKKKGMRLSFKNESIPKLQQGSFVRQTVPSFTLKIGL